MNSNWFANDEIVIETYCTDEQWEEFFKTLEEEDKMA
jgi:hypothetical protein